MFWARTICLSVLPCLDVWFLALFLWTHFLFLNSDDMNFGLSGFIPSYGMHWPYWQLRYPLFSTSSSRIFITLWRGDHSRGRTKYLHRCSWLRGLTSKLGLVNIYIGLSSCRIVASGNKRLLEWLLFCLSRVSTKKLHKLVLFWQRLFKFQHFRSTGLFLESSGQKWSRRFYWKPRFREILLHFDSIIEDLRDNCGSFGCHAVANNEPEVLKLHLVEQIALNFLVDNNLEGLVPAILPFLSFFVVLFPLPFFGVVGGWDVVQIDNAYAYATLDGVCLWCCLLCDIVDFGIIRYYFLGFGFFLTLITILL